MDRCPASRPRPSNPPRAVRLLAAAWLVAAAPGASSAVHVVDPADTDARIAANEAPHYAYFEESAVHRNRLFVFFGGAYSKPRHFQELAHTAAALGYHVINLSFPNNFLINSGICARSFDSSCHENVRMEVYDGIDRHAAIDVGRPDCIENRLAALLRHLADEHPSEQWTRYLRGDGSPRWPQMVLGGHSQGAAYASLIAKFKPVRRALLFAGFDWYGPEERPADWMYRPSATAAEAIFAFSHRMSRSEWGPDQRVFQAWQVLYLDAFGPLVDVDVIAPPYQGSHTLITNAPPACVFGDCSDYHSAVVVDAYTPRLPDGQPLYRPVWEYMLGK